MNEQGALPPEPAPWPVRVYRLHLLVYRIAMVLMIIINIIVGGGWFMFWPMFLWSFAFSLHMCVHKSLYVDSEWVRERAFDLRIRSYDLGHIEDIGQRIKDDHYSTLPTDDRELYKEEIKRK